MGLKTVQPDNPILRAELQYQRRHIPDWLQWFDRLGVIVVALAISVGLLYAPVLQDGYGASRWPHPALVYGLWGIQLVVILRCLLAGFYAARYQQSGQWDVLALTGISSQRLFGGKWWSAVHQVRGWMVGLGIVKLAALAVVILNLVVYCYRDPLGLIIRNVDYYSHGPRPFIENGFQQLPTSFPALPPVDRIVITGVHTVATTVLEVLASTALGLAGGVMPQRVMGLVGALAVRYGAVVVFSLFPYAPKASGLLVWRWYEYTSFSLADGGSTAILRAGLISRSTVYAGNPARGSGVMESVVLAFLAVVGMYLAYLLVSFAVSHLLLRRQGILAARDR